MKREKVIHVVMGPDGSTVSLGAIQIEWALKQELVKPSEREHAEWNLYDSDLTAMELHQRVWAEPSLRECDFCRLVPAPWEVPCRPFVAMQGGQEGPLGGPDRPLVACDTCVELVRSNRKEALMDRAMTAAIKAAKVQGEYLRAVVQSHSDLELRAHLRPSMRSVVYGMFHHRDGFPRRAEFPNEQTGVSK